MGFELEAFSDAELDELKKASLENGFSSVSDYLLSLHREKKSRQAKYFTDEEKSTADPTVFFETDLGTLFQNGMTFKRLMCVMIDFQIL